MNTNFIVQPINYTAVQHLFEFDSEKLSKQGIVKMTVDEFPGFPCRVSLEDAEIGEEVLLFTYPHHDADSPYNASGPIFVRKDAQTASFVINEIPKMLEHRLLSLRAYNQQAMMIDARTVKGEILQEKIKDILQNESVSYIQIHNSGPGCFNCQVNRVLD